MRILEIILPVLIMLVLGMACRKLKLLTKSGIDNMKLLVTNIMLSCTGHSGLQCGDLETGGDYVRYAGGIFRSRISVEAAYERRIPQVPAVYGQCI